MTYTNPYMNTPNENLLALVQKPTQYIGREWNIVRKDPHKVKAKIGLAFPDVYEVGMSHLGLRILYSIVNSRQDLAAERLFAPFPDMEKFMRKEGLPLITLETGDLAEHLDIIGFSLQYELCSTTVLQMLDLAGIPLRSEDRGLGHPFVIGGGPIAFNPVPLTPYFDAFALGDGEELIIELADTYIQWKEQGGTREELLKQWKHIQGVYVPSLHQGGEKVQRRIVPDLNTVDFPTRLIVPFCETVHDRVGVEIARGCTRGCRFCQAGILYRPVRERESSAIVEIARQSLAQTGWEEVALLSLSSGDYSNIGALIKRMVNQFGDEKVALSLPSLRTETMVGEIAEQIRRVRKTGFTLAPEAGSDRLRRVINKGNTEEDLERAISGAFQAGWKSVKLYFMIGLPYETDQDLDDIVKLITKASKWARGGKITASVSTFVPKSHTPFQWAEQMSIDETERRQAYIRSHFRKGRVRVKFHNARISFLEGALARGNARVASVIQRAFENGARLDGWDEYLKFDTWMAAYDELELDPKQFLQKRELWEGLPWSFIDTGVDSDYLIQEWHRAEKELHTDDCRQGACQECGVCDFDQVHPRISDPITVRTESCTDEKFENEIPVKRFRLLFEKIGLMKFLGHHDMVRTFHRAFRRARLKLDYSKGYHPQPKMRFTMPIPVGVESVAEYVEFDLLDTVMGDEELKRLLCRSLPDGLNPLELKEISLNHSSICGKIQQVIYEIIPPPQLSHSVLERRVSEFESSRTFTVSRERKGKTRSWDLKEWVTHIALSNEDLAVRLKAGPSGSVNVLLAVGSILGISEGETRTLQIRKVSVILEDDLV